MKQRQAHRYTEQSNGYWEEGAEHESGMIGKGGHKYGDRWKIIFLVVSTLWGIYKYNVAHVKHIML